MCAEDRGRMAPKRPFIPSGEGKVVAIARYDEKTSKLTIAEVNKKESVTSLKKRVK